VQETEYMAERSWQPAEYFIGKDAYGRMVNVRHATTFTGKDVWSLHRDPGDATDDAEAISGLTAENILALAALVRLYISRAPTQRPG
jgi:hypothetical protein